MFSIKKLPTRLKHVLSKRRFSWIASDFLQLSPAVRCALNDRRPVVALESAIITQGMPRPYNFRTAKEVEEIVLENGAMPATIAVMDGRFHVGLASEQLESLAFNESAVKLSTLDLAVAASKQLTGGTTVAATMQIAHRCGISIFVTGGIGGVHRGAETTFDISADLTQLADTPVHVVCSGVKSILDIPKTLEYLETQGVPVVTFGSTKEFPAFFTSASGRQTRYNFKNANEAAAFVHANQQLGLSNGSVIAVPVPSELSCSGELAQAAIKQSLREAEQRKISGAKVTPFVLEKVNQITEGESLNANIGLVKNNAKVGAQISAALCQHRGGSRRLRNNSSKGTFPLVIGASVVDFVSKASEDLVFGGPSNAVDVTVNPGGVGRNIAEGILRMGGRAQLLSVVGEDGNGMFLRQSMAGMDLLFETVPNHSTGIYQLVCSKNGDVAIGFQDMKINQKFTSDIIDKHRSQLAASIIVCMDGNLPKETTKRICELCRELGKDLLFDPADAIKCGLLTDFLDGITYFMPNINEIETMATAKSGSKQSANINMSKDKLDDDDLGRLAKVAAVFNGNVKHTMLSLGKFGLLWIGKIADERFLRYYPLDILPEFDFLKAPIQNVSGSGDTFAAAFVCAVNAGRDIDSAIKYGLVAAQHTVRSNHTISDQLDTNLFNKFDVQSWDGYLIPCN